MTPPLTSLRILADDLTGALDAAAPLARAGQPVRLLRSGTETWPHQTLSTESRDMAEAGAVAAVLAGHARLRPGTSDGTLWFKKVDSVLRGHPLAETLAMMRAGGFSRCIFAPAFPQMGRITRQGRQLVRQEGGGFEETPQGDLRAAFARLAPGAEIILPNVESPQDLRAVVEIWRDRPGTLWAGSRGLAEALSSGNAPLPPPPVGLFILGTSHPATRAQARALAGETHAVAAEGRVEPTAAHPFLLDPVPGCSSGAETRAALTAAMPRLDRPADGSAIFVVGGDSLTVVLDGLQVQALDCLGEVGVGLPLSQMIGGPFDGGKIITKSGGFGAPGLLRGFLQPGHDRERRQFSASD